METLAPPAVPPSLSQMRSTVLFLVLLVVVEGSRSTILAPALLAFGLMVCNDYRRQRSTLALWAALSSVAFAKVILLPAQWSAAAVLSLQLAAVAGAFLTGSALKYAIVRCNIRFAATVLIAAGLAVSLTLPVHGFIFNRLLMIGALMLVSSGRRALSAPSILVAVAVAGIQFMQGSRASALLVIGVSAWYVATVLFRRGMGGRVVVVTFSVVGMAIAIVASLWYGPLRQRVFVHGDVSRGLYLADRNKLATSALRVLSEHASTLFLGARPGTYRHVDGLGLIYPYPHNIVFQLLMDFGVIVGALLLVLIVALFMRSLQGVEQKGVADRCCAVVALGLVLLALFNGTYMDYRFAALWLGAALASEVTSPARAELLPTAAMAW